MLTIRREQMQIFEAESERTFQAEVAAQLRSSHAARIADLPADVLHRRVAAGLAQARAHGLSWKSSCTIFVMLMFDLGPEFDRQSPFKEQLADEAMSPDERVEVLLDAMTEDAWRRARSRAALWPDERH